MKKERRKIDKNFIKQKSGNGTEQREKFYDEKNSAVKNYKVFKKTLILMNKLRNSSLLHRFLGSQRKI